MKVDLNGTDLSHLSGISSSQRTDTGTSSAGQVESDQQLAPDTTTLSSDSAAIRSLAAKALAVPEVRQDKVDALRQAIQNGDYKVDPGKIAQAMIGDSE